MIITIGRQYGSGGKEIGEKLAAKLGCAFYDSELLSMATEANGMSEAAMRQYDEKPTSSLVYGMYMNAISTGDVLPLNQKLAFAQFDVIRKVAGEGDCVIVGRCADYVLRDRKDLLSVFLHAPTDSRRQRAIANYGVPPELAEKTLKKQDKKRAEYYNFYTHRTWSAAETYDLTLDTDLLGVDGTVEIIAAVAERLGK
jgi:cytidylate kinase